MERVHPKRLRQRRMRTGERGHGAVRMPTGVEETCNGHTESDARTGGKHWSNTNARRRRRCNG